MQSDKTKLFIEKARAIHGDRYDYSLVEYIRSVDKVSIACKEHGVFEQKAKGHLNGKGCAKCSGTEKLSTETFIEKARAKHGDRYSYELVEYVRARDKVKITCKQHGAFEQTPNAHLRGKGCFSCNGNQKMSSFEFSSRSALVHGGKYDYAKSAYINSSTKIEILCPAHGIFTQTPNAHMAGKGCLRCVKTLNTNDFILKAKSLHGKRYAYDEAVWKGSRRPTSVKCARHGYFKITPNDHLNGRGCPSCAFDRAQPTNLYILTNGQKIKVGISHKPEQRLAQLTKASPFAIEHVQSWTLPNFNAAQELEKRIHKRLAHLNAQYEGFDGATEWFEVSPTVAIKEITKVVNNSQQLALI